MVQITIAKPRRGGKTTDLIRLSAATGDRIVTKNVYTSKYVIHLACQMNLKIPRPITFDSFLDGHWRGLRITGFLIDDSDQLFLRMLDRVVNTNLVHAMTITAMMPLPNENIERLLDAVIPVRTPPTAED